MWAHVTSICARDVARRRNHSHRMYAALGEERRQEGEVVGDGVGPRRRVQQECDQAKFFFVSLRIFVGSPDRKLRHALLSRTATWPQMRIVFH